MSISSLNGGHTTQSIFSLKLSEGSKKVFHVLPLEVTIFAISVPICPNGFQPHTGAQDR
jgi:hypothetical protein